MASRIRRRPGLRACTAVSPVAGRACAVRRTDVTARTVVRTDSEAKSRGRMVDRTSRHGQPSTRHLWNAMAEVYPQTSVSVIPPDHVHRPGHAHGRTGRAGALPAVRPGRAGVRRDLETRRVRRGGQFDGRVEPRLDDVGALAYPIDRDERQR